MFAQDGLPDVARLFIELAAIASPPGEERPVADRVLGYLRDLKLDVDEDDAGPRVGSTMGNLLCRIPPTDGAAGAPLFLCAHLDTVPPDGAIEPVVEDGVIRNGRPTILGADDKSAVAVMLEAVRRLIVERRPHAGVELLFTPKEEVGLCGANAFDQSRLTARIGYVYDHAAPIGDVILGAPHQASIDATFRGKAAHAGMYPEEGRSAIAAAARAIADLRLGRLDDETTANVGTIEGGSARNVVPETCSFQAEARSHDRDKLAELVREMLESFAFAASLGDCEVETHVDEHFSGYRFRPSDEPVRLAVEALERTGYEPRFVLSGGGADANVFNERGLQCLNLANGMASIHSADEHIAVADLEGMVEVTLALVDAAREA
ncbi:MAG: M20/M25/M40 family metallo-hydrolase [Thermoleophilia bacterium]|nr:M20/M25/M40 family metallo-hydrolase [Thermoleophilia bacterium]